MSWEVGPSPKQNRWNLRMKGAVVLVAVASIYATVELATHAIVPEAIEAARRALTRSPDRPPLNERATEALFREVEGAEFWSGKPHIFEASRRLMRAHFIELSPMLPHPRMEPVFPILSAYQLAKRGPLYAGKKVTMVGVVHYLTVAGLATRSSPAGKLLIYLVQVGIANRDDPLIYCRFVAPATAGLRAGDQLVVVGVLMAEGPIKLSEGGFAEGGYFAGAMAGPFRNPKEVVDAATRESERT